MLFILPQDTPGTFPEASSAGSWGGQGCSLPLFDPESRLAPPAPPPGALLPLTFCSSLSVYLSSIVSLS